MPAATAKARVEARWRNHAMGCLLALMVVGIFVLPLVVGASADISWAGEVVLLMILVSGIAAIREFRRTSALLGLLVFVLSVVWFFERSIRWHGPLLALALLVLAIAIGVNVFAARRRLADRLLGAIALYLLVALIFAAIYATFAATVPGAFSGTVPMHALLDWGYFSLVTLTTLGYGDITPVAHAARALAVLEALIGQLYPAIIIARLVSAQPVANRET